ncbi:MAG TPA: hypothetical protein VFE58_08080 [Tepidisphaeraceae bacterium]|jgi:hypothetical protein|nr:hypothetical protein [Tepidisphaeraceae bacterium]
MTDDNSYDLAEDLPTPRPTPPPGKVLPYQSQPTKLSPSATDIDNLKDFQIPLALLCLGLVIQPAADWLIQRHTLASAQLSLLEVFLGLALSTAIMIPAMFLIARFRAINFGPLPTAILKWAAISVAPGAATSLLLIFLRFIPFGSLAAFLAGFCLYFALIGVFFDLDQSDTWYCVMVTFIIKVAIYFALIYYIH